MFSETPNLTGYEKTIPEKTIRVSSAGCLSRTDGYQYFIYVSHDIEIIEGFRYELYIAGRPYSMFEHTIRMEFVLYNVFPANGMFEGTGFANIIQGGDRRALVGRRNEWRGDHIRYMDPENAVSAYLSRGRKRLRAVLEDRETPDCTLEKGGHHVQKS